jgi:prepilin-type N-terminal cleavage/methylation domain-containing protein
MKRAFSLIELTVVLVIVALVVGGITVGQSTMRNSQVVGLLADISRVQSAINTFKIQYSSLPGDMFDATTQWGALSTVAATCRTTTITGGTNTCDGNGDGQITTFDSGTTYSEYWHFWQHLSNASIWEGFYTGVAGSGNIQHAVPDENVPEGRVSNSGYTVHWLGMQSSSSNYYDGSYGNVMTIGAEETTGVTDGATLEPQEAWRLDKKVDDSKPAYGSVRAPIAAINSGCTTSDTASSAEYDVDATDKLCSVIAKTGF